MRRSESDWKFAIRVTRPALLLAPRTFLSDSAARLADAGIIDAVRVRDTAKIFNWLIGSVAFQGISDAIALDYDARHGGIRYREIGAALQTRPVCRRLRSYWAFDSCGYRKSTFTCSEPGLVAYCPLPQHDLRKGALNIAAYSLFLFIRDVCGGDFVGWIDARLAAADISVGIPGREARMQAALFEPLGHVYGVGSKLWNMILADFLLSAAPERERWRTTGGSMIAIDTLMHNFLHRTGVLNRLGSEHAYGAACYAPDGCAEVILGLAQHIDAGEFNRTHPAIFPRFVQLALWLFCAALGWDICNGNNIDDRRRCENTYCPAFADCDRVPLKGPRD